MKVCEIANILCVLLVNTRLREGVLGNARVYYAVLGYVSVLMRVLWC